MKRFLLALPILSLPFLVTSCTTNANVEVGGVPKFFADGAKLSSEPEPLRPDPVIQHHDEESGPVELKIITDKKKYPNSPAPKKKKKVEKEWDYERGRDSRIRRLF